MVAFRAIRVALLLSGLHVAAGCGTVENLVKPGPVGGGKVPFGGVKQDLACLKKPAPGSESEQQQQQQQAGLALLAAADLPFSLIGDLVTWPYTAAYSFINEPLPPPPVFGGAPPPAPRSPWAPEYEVPYKEPGRKTPQKGRQKDGDSDVLPPPRPLPEG